MAITAPASRSSVLGAKDEPGGASDGVSHLTPGRIERRGAGRVRVGEALAATDELETAGLPGSGVGGVLQERSERLSEFGDAAERVDGRPVAVGAGRGEVYDGATVGPDRMPGPTVCASTNC